MGAASTIKYLLFFFNLLIFIGGILTLALSIVVTIHVSGHGAVKWNTALIILIAAGSCIVLVSFLGCCGAIKESQCMLTTFGVLLSILFVVQVTGAILMFVFKDDVKTGINSALKLSLKKYYVNGTENTKDFWDSIQKNFKCCGVDFSNDWLTAGNVLGIPPKSCKCEDSSAACSLTYYSDGCYLKLTHYVTQNGVILAAIAIGLALVELIGAIFSFRLASTIRKREHGFY